MFKILIDKHLGMFIPIWTDIKILHVVSSDKTKGVGKVNRREGKES